MTGAGGCTALLRSVVGADRRRGHRVGGARRDEGRRHRRTACDMRSSGFAAERGLRIRDDQGERVFQRMRRGRAVAMRTSMWMLGSQYDLSALWPSTSECLDNFYDLQYGLELVIPMSSRRLETR